MFDSKAVVSVTTEINKRPRNTGSKQTQNKDKRVSGGVRKLGIHPMDLLVVVMNCCDDFLRQVLVEKMVANKLSIPILLPEVRNGSSTLLLLALRSLVPEVPELIRECSASLVDTLVDVKNPVVSFIRLGELHRSKSKLVNELLNFTSFNTFFHRDCPNGSVKRSVSNGSIEAAWFQSSRVSEEEFNCRLFTALNLRGDAREYPKQTQFLCQSSTLVVFMVDSFEPFKELYERVLKDADVSQTKVIVCYISTKSSDETNKTNFELWNDSSGHGIIFDVKYDWDDEDKMSDVEFTNDLRETISQFFKPEHRHSKHMPTYVNISRSKQDFGFSLDEDKSEYKSGKVSAQALVNLALDLTPDCKPTILPLQGEPWERIGELERKQRRKSENIMEEYEKISWKSMKKRNKKIMRNGQDEHFITEKETEKRTQRAIQCRSLMQQHQIAEMFCLELHRLQEQCLSYYLNSCKIKLDARSEAIVSNIMEEYEKEKQENHAQRSTEGKPEVELNNAELQTEVKLSKMESKIGNSILSLEHILRECGQMYEAVISEEIRLREELKKASVTPDVIRNFPSIVAKLLLRGHQLELMDGDASNVPITWLKAVLDQLTIMTKNAKVFVLSIIGVQSSGKSTLLNALFGLQFPVSAGRCTKGIYCHLVPVDKESLIMEFDYVLVVDTEGLGASKITGKSTFRDNELATFAIGLADATIINMKGESWAEIKDILQIVAHGLICIRKTKAELELMPKCMFVHQNVPAADAVTKIRLNQEKQLMHLDKATQAAALAEGFAEITQFNQVINYNPELHTWYFPDLWDGRPPKAKISQYYTGKVNELRQYLIQLMKTNPKKLEISSFSLRLSDLWTAILHNDFVLCFRNTQEIISSTVLNDRISHEVDGFKNLNKLEQTKICESVCSFANVAELRAEQARILKDVSDAVEKNFTNMKVTLQEAICDSDICAPLKERYEITFNAIREEELRRRTVDAAKAVSAQIKKLEYGDDQRVREVKAKLAELEKSNEEVMTDTLDEAQMKEFNESWRQLTDSVQILVNHRINSVEGQIKETILGSLKKLQLEETVRTALGEEMLKTTVVVEMPQVTEKDIVQEKESTGIFSKANLYTVKSSLYNAYKKWELQFQNQRGLEFNASSLEQVMYEVGQLLGILAEEEVRPGAVEISSGLPPGYSFTHDYTIRFIKFVCNYTYNRSVENSKVFLSKTNPVAHIVDPSFRTVSHYRVMTPEENIDAVSEQILDYAKRSFVEDLGELIKTEVCKADNRSPTFKSKRAFLRTILTDLGQKTNNLLVTHAKKEKENIFKEFMLYVEMAESQASERFFLDEIVKLLKEMLTKGNTPETDFQIMVENYVGKVVEKVKNALTHAETNCKGCPREYIRLFKAFMDVRDEIDFRIGNLTGFTEGVVEKINNLYAGFFNQANYLFETLVCEDNKAAICPLFEKIMGCRERCPFCSAPCSQSFNKHTGDHRANHYPMGVRGTVDCWGLFRNIQETPNASGENKKKPRKLALSTCQAMVGSRVGIRTVVTVSKATKWYHRNYHPFKSYKELDEYKDWDIQCIRDHNASLFWKWFMANFVQELAEHFNALRPKIPTAWKDVTWEEAKGSLD